MSVLERLGSIRIERSWLDQLSSVVLALVLALLIWLAASEDARPMTTTEFPPSSADDIEIEFRNVPSGLSVFDPEPRRAKLRLRGIEDGVQGLSAASFEVWADLSEQSEGIRSATVPLSVKCATSCRSRGIRIQGSVPEMVSLRLSATMTRTAVVELESEDELPPGYLMGSYVVTPTNVSLIGAAVPVSRAQRLVAEVSGLSDVLGEHLFERVPVVPLDATDQLVRDVEMIPATVDVLVRPRRSQAVAVVPSIEGQSQVADGYLFSAVWVEPKVVELDGPPDLVRELGSAGRVYTAPVDLTGMSGDSEWTVDLNLPEGVIALNAPQGVTVTVEIDTLPGTLTLELEIGTRELPDGLAAEITPDRVQVLLSGPQPELDALDETEVVQVRAYVDLDGLAAGAHRVAVQVEAPSALRVQSVTPEEVEVVIAAEESSGLPTTTAVSDEG